MSIDQLRNDFRGELLEPGDTGYERARIVWNGMIDRRPAVIARCRNVADVVFSVNYAREHDLLIAVRSGGHNVAGYAVCEGGMMIDLSLMNSVRVPPDLGRVFVEGGATWADVDAATTPFGRATPGGLISATGVAGLALVGGIGWLRGKHGLSCDNIVSVDLVTADGRLVRASSSENPDLFWALRGGGGNFGIVANFEFMLHEIPPLLMFCAPVYPEERAVEVLTRWRDYMADAPDEVTGLAEFSTIPHDPAYPQNCWGRRVLSLATVFDGPAETGELVTRPLRQFGAPLMDFSDRMPYRILQTLYDGLFPKGRDRCYWKSTYLAHLKQETIEAIVAGLDRRPSEMTFASVWKIGGQVGRVAADATAFGDRSMPFMLSLDAVWSSPPDDEANIAWVKSVWNGMQVHSTGRSYLNFPGLGEGQNLVRDAFGPGVFERLLRIKRKYDPGNLFRMNQNIWEQL
ncbi:FAD-binding oxidoreductase [Rhizobium calliandrae]|uniref:FAD-binding oxidoreductase n=1 Tax=Rhizobium calliandrae TaxID=1312182 RepID=A0ABT7KIN1_9HYPH|nr:FAD-binding oxidoreductase [Rhizobium calliandrae]MDL2408495.1 FAD-binding oxidoreductase [Rhizobium calliandrae]